uniref:Uncharacterized protein n=1 Tax=Solanum tuberosum TaxID=4113 RepID=M1DVZ5_SOLTU
MLWRYIWSLWRCNCSGVVAAVAGSTRLKVVNKLLNNLIMHFSTFRAKERTQATPTRFSPFLRLKTKNKRKESGKGSFKSLRGFKLGFEVGDGCDFTIV